MSTKYTGGFITKSPVAPTTSAASGIWTLDQQQQAQKAGTWPSPPMFIEDLFSTYLYTGQGSTNSYINGIDLATNGGLVWIKARSGTYGTAYHSVFDTARGTGKIISTNTTSAQTGNTGDLLSAFNSDGFTVNTTYLGGFNESTNASATNYASWTFRKQPKFFDIVTYTGNGTAGLTINHNLGSVPGCIIVKSMTSAVDWAVYHRSLGATKFLNLNLTGAASTSTFYWNNTEPTSTTFTVGDSGRTNGNGETYVAYLFAHDAGGFPVSGGGSTNGISCGSFTANANTTVNLGYEPQWILFKNADGAFNWAVVDAMRGWTADGNFNILKPNLSDAESSETGVMKLTSTGFQWVPAVSGNTYIYIAIRKGPMKTPTVGTSVFSPIASNASTGTTNTTGFAVDLQINAERNAVHATPVVDRLRGVITTPTDATSPYLRSDTTVGENPETITRYWNNTGFETSVYQSGVANVYWNFGRAPSFFDEVCYTGDGTLGRVITHNLGVAPELIISKSRSVSGNWRVGTLFGATTYSFLNLSTVGSQTQETYTSAFNFGAAPTSTNFTTGNNSGFYGTNASGTTYVTYLFATCAGVSKVGSYTGTGATQTINCGFTGGARFVLIKEYTDGGSGNWWIWDTARGMVSGTDPRLALSSTSAEINSDWVYATSGGFQIVTTDASVNASGTGYIFLAIA